jgi:di/tricarboxylate transporter
MTAAMLLTLVVIVAVLGLMMANLAPPDLLLVGGVVILASAKVITPAEAFAGFSNAGMLTVAALFVVAAGLRETGAVTLLTSRLLGAPTNERRAVARLVAPVIAASAFLNNTTIVATLLPAVTDWSRRMGLPPGRFLMPLSFAAILGGTCTLIGTSTNLVVVGLIEDLAPEHPGLTQLGMFDITPLGLAVALAGGLTLVLLAPILLPDHHPALSTDDDPRRYTMELLVQRGSALIGTTAEAGGLRNLPGAYLMELVRGDELFAPVDATMQLHEGDRLVFVGDVDAVVDLQRHPGLTAAPDQVFKLQGDRRTRRIVESVVSPQNPIVGQTIRECTFRNRYDAVVIAVARAGERVAGRIGDIRLRGGDVLMLEAGQDFITLQRHRNDFTLVGAVEGAAPPRYEKAWVAGLILLAVVFTITLELMSTVNAAFLGAGAMVLSRCCTVEEARKALDVTVLAAIAAAFGLGEAMQATGLDRMMAEFAIAAGASSPFLGLIAIYVVTTLLTELITNNAAAVLTVPIAVALAEQLGVPPMGYVIAVMFAASASFLSPIGYQTNLMVYNAGGYKPLDYPRLGLPLSIIVGVVTVVMIPLFWPLSR